LPQEITTAKWLQRQAKHPARGRITINLAEDDLIALSVVAQRKTVTSASYAREVIIRKLKREVPDMYKNRKTV
jgi:hypothetical protein